VAPREVAGGGVGGDGTAHALPPIPVPNTLHSCSAVHCVHGYRVFQK
jgi:hypothetical protein